MSIPIKYIKGEKGNIFYPYTTIDAVLNKDKSAGGTSIKDTMLNVIPVSDIENNQLIISKEKNETEITSYLLEPSNYKGNYTPTMLNLITSDEGEDFVNIGRERNNSTQKWKITPIIKSFEDLQNVDTIKLEFDITFPPKINITGANGVYIDQATFRLSIFLGDENNHMIEIYFDNSSPSNNKISVSGKETDNYSHQSLEDKTYHFLFTIYPKTNKYSYQFSNNSQITYDDDSLEIKQGNEEFVFNNSFGLSLSGYSGFGGDRLKISKVKIEAQTANKNNKFTLFLKETEEENKYEPIFYRNGKYYYLTLVEEEDNT